MEAINELKSTVEAENYGVDPSIPLVTPELVLPIKVELHRWVMEIGIIEYDDVVQGFEMLSINFSKLTLVEFYAVQQEAATEVHIRENAMSYHKTKQKRKAIACKTLLREKEQEIVVRE